MRHDKSSEGGPHDTNKVLVEVALREVRKIVDTALYLPSGSNRQTCRVDQYGVVARLSLLGAIWRVNRMVDSVRDELAAALRNDTERGWVDIDTFDQEADRDEALRVIDRAILAVTDDAWIAGSAVRQTTHGEAP